MKGRSRLSACLCLGQADDLHNHSPCHLSSLCHNLNCNFTFILDTGNYVLPGGRSAGCVLRVVQRIVVTRSVTIIAYLLIC